MGLIDQLVPFVRFGQLISFLPYRIERNSETAEARFKFSWCHPLTIWFILGLSFQCLPLVTSIISINYFQGEFDKVQMPFLMNLLFLVATMFHNLTIFVSRGIHLRYHQLRSVIDLLTANVVVKLEEFQSFPASSNNLKMKILFGILVILVAVITNIN